MRLISVTIGVFVLVLLFELIRRRRLKERHAALWALLSIALIALAAFPGISQWLADVTGFVLPSNLLLFFSVGVLFGISIQLSVEIAGLDDDLRTVAEELALMSARLERLESNGPPDEQTR